MHGMAPAIDEVGAFPPDDLPSGIRVCPVAIPQPCRAMALIIDDRDEDSLRFQYAVRTPVRGRDIVHMLHDGVRDDQVDSLLVRIDQCFRIPRNEVLHAYGITGPALLPFLEVVHGLPYVLNPLITEQSGQ